MIGAGALTTSPAIEVTADELLINKALWGGGASSQHTPQV